MNFKLQYGEDFDENYLKRIMEIDEIVYAKDGYVHHVVMYAGDGKTIEAANEDQGIISGTVYIPEAVWATRILEENYNLEGTDVNEQNAQAAGFYARMGFRIV